MSLQMISPPTLTVLENFLQQFQGSLIIVSHDRYFMDRIVDHILAFEGDGKIKDFIGNFSEYRESKKTEDRSQKSENISDPVNVVKPVTNQQPASPRKKLSFKEQRELETIEKEMPEFESSRNKILDQLNNEADYEKIAKLSAELETISEKLENHELRWLELQEILGEN